MNLINNIYKLITWYLKLLLTNMCHDPHAASFLRTTWFISRIAGNYPNIKTKVITYIKFIKRTKDSLKSKAC